MASKNLRSIMCGLTWIVLTAGLAAAADANLPRYKLQAGQELKYLGQSEFKYDGGRYGTRDTWTVWVVKQNPDGGWRLLIRYGNEFVMARQERAKPAPKIDDEPKEGEKNEAKEPAEKKDAPPKEPAIEFTGKEDVTFAWCDMSPDGRIAQNDSFGFRMRPESLLPRLPSSSAELTSGWRVRDERMDEEYAFTRTTSGRDGVFEMQMARESPMNVIYGMEQVSTVRFDLTRGIPVEDESRTAQTYGFKGQGTGKMTLIEVSTKPAEWCAKFLAEAEQYFAANQAYDKALDDTSKPVDEFKLACATARTNLQAAGEKIESPELKAVIQEKLDDEQRMEKYRVESLTDRLAVLGMASEEWSTTDVTGQPVGIKDLAGKVVVLDFWYRGCGWCIRAMPQMKQIATHFEGKPVAVLGMNTDRKEEDAQFVIDTMKLNYNTLKATGLPEKYKVKGFPTLVILDRKGVVRDVHVGYSPTLKKEVVESVEKLLGEKE